MDSQPESASWLKDLAPAVSWVLVIIGWWVVSSGHNKREHRKEVRAQIGKIQELIDRIEASAFKYWTNGADNEAARVASDLKRDLQRLSRQITRVAKSCPGVSVTAELIDFRQAVTGGEFESKARVALGSDGGRLYEIWGAAQDLIEKIEAGFSAKYPTR